MQIGIFNPNESIAFLISTVSGLIFLFGGDSVYMLGNLMLGHFEVIGHVPEPLLSNYITFPCGIIFILSFCYILRGSETVKPTLGKVDIS